MPGDAAQPRSPGAPPVRSWRFLVTPKWIAWHVFVICAVLGMLWLGNWQLHRAESGNSLSWAYTFEWPIFAIMGVVFWIKTIRDEFRGVPPDGKPGAGDPAAVDFPGAAPPARGGTEDGAPAEEDDPELAAYNAYLAKLNEQVRGHGRWHGLR
jgi:hypothetical protein